MCGIIGGVGLTKDEAYQGLLNIKRGNDGITVKDNDGVVIGSRRHLVKKSSKDDVGGDESDQPYNSDDGKIHLVFNGELYNFSELRDELVGEGKKFLSEGDTEVFLRLYEHRGIDFVKYSRIDSMFAIAIHDERNKKLLITRDWPGRVPLFYYYNPEEKVFIFSSELKGLRPIPHVNLSKPIELKPGHTAVLDLETFELKIEQYYRPEIRKQSQPLLKVGEELHKLLKRSAQDRTMGDVPICTMLSGGLDSLLTTHYVFSSIDFNKVSYKPISYVFAVDGHESEDVRRAKIAAEGFKPIGLELKEIRVSADQVVSDIRDIIEIFEMRKIKALSVYPLPIYYYLAPEMKKDGFKVTIGGHGVDELFGAYDSWKELNKSHKVQINHKSRLAFINAIYENMMRRASIIFMNRGPIEARFPFLEVQVCEYCLSVDPKWLSISTSNAEALLSLINERAGSKSSWTKQIQTIYTCLEDYLDNNGSHPEGADEEITHEVDKLFWKLPVVVAGMFAAEESTLPVSTLFNSKLRGQHGSGLTALEHKIVERYRHLGNTDTEIYKSFVREAFDLEDTNVLDSVR